MVGYQAEKNIDWLLECNFYYRADNEKWWIQKLPISQWLAINLLNILHMHFKHIKPHTILSLILKYDISTALLKYYPNSIVFT